MWACQQRRDRGPRVGIAAMTNEIDLRLERGEYVGGDTVYGSVYLRIQQQVSRSSLKLVIRGFETCRYDYQYIEQRGQEEERDGEEGEGEFTSQTGQRTTIKDIIKQEFTIGEGLFPMGCYAYPFMYRLPHNLPGVFNARYEATDEGGSWEGDIQYTVSAMLVVPGAANSRVSTERGLVVYDSLECRNLAAVPQPQSALGSARTFFCISRGNVHVTCKLLQNSYIPSSQVVLSVLIKNDSSVDVTGFTANLLRVVKLQALDRMRGEEELSTHTILTTLLETEGQGCPHNRTMSHEVVLNLDLAENTASDGVPPNTSGFIVKCNYVIDVNVHIPWGPDVEVRQPLLIRAADNEAWKAWTPPPWIDRCVKAHAMGAIAVTDNDLSLSSFAGIPGFRPDL